LLPFFSEEYKEEKESKRKEKLMHRMIELLDKGRDWERAIDLCKSLRKYYKNTWQFSELGLLHQKEGTFYTNVMSFKRFPTFYYVAFYGKGFKEMGLEGVYLFKSKELENHVDFSEKMKLKYPGAEILTKIDKDALNEKEGKYLEIYAITPITDREIKNLYEPRDTRRLPSIVRNEQLKTVPYLSTTRRYRESKEKAKDGFEFVDMHREIRVFVVPEPYPATRRRQKCNDTIIVDLGPIENAIKDVEDKNLDLQDEAIHRQLNLTEDRTGDTRDLSRLLTGIIDAAVNGGTKKYVDVFFGEPYRTNDREKLLRFAVALKNQMEDLKSCLYFLRYYSSGKGLALCDHLESNYGKMTEVFDPIFKEYLDGVPVQPVEQPTTEQSQN
jgi:dedicator of cytokinesis protein 3